MCSILGFCSPQGSFSDLQDALLKTQTRGPDSSRIVDTENGWLGFNRLSIMGITENGMQPFVFGENRTIHLSGLTNTQTGYRVPETASVILVCNGEIYGFRPVRKALEEKGYSFISGSDCEILSISSRQVAATSDISRYFTKTPSLK